MHFFRNLFWGVSLFFILFMSACVSNLQIDDDKKNILSYSVADKIYLIESTDDLNAIVSKALLNSGELKYAYRMWQASILEIKNISKLPDPVFTYANYLESVETKVGPQEQSFALMQKIPFWGTLDAKAKKAYFKSLQKKAEFEELRSNLIYKVKSVYYEYIALKQSVKILQENEKLLKDLEQVVSTKYKAGEADNNDVLKIQIKMGNIAEKVISFLEMEIILKDKIKALLNLDAGIDMIIKEVSFDDIGIDIHYEKDLSVFTSDDNPRIKIIRYMLHGAESAVEEAKLGFYPDISLGATYIETGDTANNIIDNGKDPLLVLCSINLPLNIFARRDNLKSKKEILLGYEDLLVNKKLALEADIKMFAYQIKDAKRKIGLYKDALIPKAKQVLNVSYTSYKAGKYSFINLIEDEKRLLDFELEWIQAKLAYLKAIASLENILNSNLNK